MLIIAIISILAAISVPTMLSARKAANEMSAINSLRAIVAAQSIYLGRSTAGTYGSLSDLATANLIDESLSVGRKQGYLFDCTPDAAEPVYAFTSHADPAVNGSTGDRFFFVDQSGVIRFNDSNQAGSTDGAIGNR